MSTIELANLGTSDVGTPSSFTAVGHVYVESREIDLAEAVTTKGSALAQADVIEAVPVPADCLILGGGIKITSVMTGTSTDATIDVGVTGGVVDCLVDGFDLDGASANATSLASPFEPQYVAANDTVDILIATQTGTITGGKILVWVIIGLVGEPAAKAPGRVQLGS